LLSAPTFFSVQFFFSYSTANEKRMNIVSISQHLQSKFNGQQFNCFVVILKKMKNNIK